MTPERRVEALYVYPLKGGPAVAVDAWEPTAAGFRDDRRFVVIDETGEFLSQRTFPVLGRLHVEIHADGLVLSDSPEGAAHLACPDGAFVDARIWDDVVRARHCQPEIDAWLSDVLGASVHLVYMPGEAHRPVHGHPANPLSFADAAPYLITTTASLADLNERIPAEPVPMLAFRPSIVVSGAAAWEEDDWEDLRIGDAGFRGFFDCERCKVTTLDPTRPDRPRRDGEPLRTLATFRRSERGGVRFGRYALLTSAASLSVGDVVVVGA